MLLSELHLVCAQFGWWQGHQKMPLLTYTTGIPSCTLTGYVVCKLISKEELLQLQQVYHVLHYDILSETFGNVFFPALISF